MIIYFWVISKEWFWVVLVGYLLQIAGLIMCYFLPESPHYLLSLNRVDETFEVFRRVAKFNGAHSFEEEADKLRKGVTHLA